MGQSVLTENLGSGSTWISGVIIEQIEPLTYIIEVSDGQLWKRRVDHIKGFAMPLPCP